MFRDYILNRPAKIKKQLTPNKILIEKGNSNETKNEEANSIITKYNTVIIKGDVNGDGVVDALDLEKLNFYLAKKPGVTIDVEMADVNDDGVVDLKDAIVLGRYLQGMQGYEVL